VVLVLRPVAAVSRLRFSWRLRRPGVSRLRARPPSGPTCGTTTSTTRPTARQRLAVLSAAPGAHDGVDFTIDTSARLIVLIEQQPARDQAVGVGVGRGLLVLGRRRRVAAACDQCRVIGTLAVRMIERENRNVSLVVGAGVRRVILHERSLSVVPVPCSSGEQRSLSQEARSEPPLTGTQSARRIRAGAGGRLFRSAGTKAGSTQHPAS